MIIDIIINIIFEIQMFFIDLLPSLPPIPESIQDGGDFIIGIAEQVGGVLSMIYTESMLAALFAITVALIAFEPLYHSTMWILKKVPMINIK